MLTGKRPHARARRFKSGSHWLREWPRAYESSPLSLSTRKKIFFNRGGREAEEEKAQKRRIFSFHGFIFAFISFKKKQENTRKTLNSLSPSSPELDSPSRLYEHPLHLNAQLILFSTGTAHSQGYQMFRYTVFVPNNPAEYSVQVFCTENSGLVSKIPSY